MVNLPSTTIILSLLSGLNYVLASPTLVPTAPSSPFQSVTCADANLDEARIPIKDLQNLLKDLRSGKFSNLQTFSTANPQKTFRHGSANLIMTIPDSLGIQVTIHVKPNDVATQLEHGKLLCGGDTDCLPFTAAIKGDTGALVLMQFD